MGDYWFDVEPSLEEGGEPVPGAEQPPAGDAMDANALEDDVVGQVARDRPGRNAEERDPPAVLHRAEGQMEC